MEKTEEAHNKPVAPLLTTITDALPVPLCAFYLYGCHQRAAKKGVTQTVMSATDGSSAGARDDTACSRQTAPAGECIGEETQPNTWRSAPEQ